MRIPYDSISGNQLEPNVSLLSLRTLKNDSTIPKSVKYQILLPTERIASLDPDNDAIVLHGLPKNGELLCYQTASYSSTVLGKICSSPGNPGTIVVQARDEDSGSDAILEIKVLPQVVTDEINCTNFLKVSIFNDDLAMNQWGFVSSLERWMEKGRRKMINLILMCVSRTCVFGTRPATGFTRTSRSDCSARLDPTLTDLSVRPFT